MRPEGAYPLVKNCQTCPADSGGQHKHDQQDRVKQVDFASSGTPDKVSYFAYTGEGYRVVVQDGSTAPTYWAYDGSNLLTEKQPGGTIEARYKHNHVLPPGIGSITEAENSTGGILHPAFDERGSPWTMAQSGSSDPEVVNLYKFGAFGEKVSAAEISHANPRMRFMTPGLVRMGFANLEAYSPVLGGPLYVPGPGVLSVGKANEFRELLGAQADPRDVVPPLPWFARDYIGRRIATWLFDKWGWTLTAQEGPSSGAAPAEAMICGPDVTAALTAVLGRIKSDFDSRSDYLRVSTSGYGKGTLCDGLLDYVHGLRAWDIIELFEYPQRAGWSPCTGGLCAIPRQPCGDSVEILGHCYHSGVVNYIMFGFITQLCHSWQRSFSWFADWIPESSPAGHIPMANAGHELYATTGSEWMYGAPTPHYEDQLVMRTIGRAIALGKPLQGLKHFLHRWEPHSKRAHKACVTEKCPSPAPTLTYRWQ